MRKLILLVCLVMGVAMSSQCQSASELGAKYRALRAYEVRPGIVMFPSLASDGQVCEMVVERHTINTSTKTTIDFDSHLSQKTIQALIDELVPLSVRGKPLTDFKHWLGSAVIDGPFVITKYEYENVIVEVDNIIRSSSASAAGHTVMIVVWRNRPCVGDAKSTTAIPKASPLRGKTENNRGTVTHSAN